MTQHDSGIGEGRGLFTGFDAYITPTVDDYSRLLTQGMVVPDTNVLLNLYRYTADARDDLFAVLERLGDQLWVPHQVIAEFWRNREAALRDPRDTSKTARELTSDRDRAMKTFQTWANRVSLKPERSTELLAALSSGFDAVMTAINEFVDRNAVDAARDTGSDAVLVRLAAILQGRVGSPMSDNAKQAAVAEGCRRVDERIPPGYMDKKKDDQGAAGDFLVWEQVLVEADVRKSDVLLVTGDVKEDWWRDESGERRGPRIELVEEMRNRTGRRLYMLRPASLLQHARTLLDVTVREESVADADRVERLLSEGSEAPTNGGWDVESLIAFLEELQAEAPVQANAIRLAASLGGFVSRDQVYELGNYPDDRSLRGFTRPIRRIAQQLKDEGFVQQAAVDILEAVYNEDSPGTGWAAGFAIDQDVLGLFAELSKAADTSR